MKTIILKKNHEQFLKKHKAKTEFIKELRRSLQIEPLFNRSLKEIKGKTRMQMFMDFQKEVSTEVLLSCSFKWPGSIKGESYWESLYWELIKSKK